MCYTTDIFFKNPNGGTNHPDGSQGTLTIEIDTASNSFRTKIITLSTALTTKYPNFKADNYKAKSDIQSSGLAYPTPLTEILTANSKFFPAIQDSTSQFELTFNVEVETGAFTPCVGFTSFEAKQKRASFSSSGEALQRVKKSNGPNHLRKIV